MDSSSLNRFLDIVIDRLEPVDGLEPDLNLEFQTRIMDRLKSVTSQLVGQLKDPSTIKRVIDQELYQLKYENIIHSYSDSNIEYNPIRELSMNIEIIPYDLSLQPVIIHIEI